MCKQHVPPVHAEAHCGASTSQAGKQVHKLPRHTGGRCHLVNSCIPVLCEAPQQDGHELRDESTAVRGTQGRELVRGEHLQRSLRNAAVVTGDAANKDWHDGGKHGRKVLWRRCLQQLLQFVQQQHLLVVRGGGWAKQPQHIGSVKHYRVRLRRQGAQTLGEFDECPDGHSATMASTMVLNRSARF